MPVAESALVPPGPIPNPVVTQCSAGEYCGGNAVGGEAAAGTSQVLDSLHATLPRGGAVAARWAHNPKVGGSNPSPATNLDNDRKTNRLRSFLYLNLDCYCGSRRRRPTPSPPFAFVFTGRTAPGRNLPALQHPGSAGEQGTSPGSHQGLGQSPMRH